MKCGINSNSVGVAPCWSAATVELLWSSAGLDDTEATPQELHAMQNWE